MDVSRRDVLAGSVFAFGASALVLGSGAARADAGDEAAVIGRIDILRKATQEADKAKLEQVKSYRLEPGHAGIYDVGAIHAIDYPEGSRFVRVTGRDLDYVERLKFDTAAGKDAGTNHATSEAATPARSSVVRADSTTTRTARRKTS